MGQYIGIHTQIQRNNRLSFLYLLGFPALILATVWAFIFFMSYGNEVNVDEINSSFTQVIPFVLIGVAIWFTIAYFFQGKMIALSTGSHTLSRKENMRVYNLLENLCISQGMPMPKLHIIEDEGLNAFASGLNEKSYRVTLTRGIVNSLNDEELEGVIAHELMHIRNHDVRLLVISIIFVGIFSFLVQILFRNMLYGSMNRRRKKDDGKAMIVALIIALVAYLLSLLFKFGLSRKREYMADAGAADMTKNPQALASALKKISGNSRVSSVKSEDVSELFIEHVPDKSAGFIGMIGGLFATHPPIEKRIAILEQM